MLQVSDYNYLEKFYKKNFIRTSKKKYHKKKKLSTTDKKNLQNLNSNILRLMIGIFLEKNVFQKKNVVNYCLKPAYKFLRIILKLIFSPKIERGYL